MYDEIINMNFLGIRVIGISRSGVLAINHRP